MPRPFYFQEKRFAACPACQSTQLAQLQLDLGGEPAVGPLRPIQPAAQTPWYTPRKGISLNGTHFQMCRDCGFLFRQEAPDGLNEFLAQYAPKASKD